MDDVTAAAPAEDVTLPVIYGTTWCPDCHRARAFLTERGIAYDEIDIDRRPEAIPEMVALAGGRKRVPTIRLADGTVLVEPSARELEAAFPG